MSHEPDADSGSIDSDQQADDLDAIRENREALETIAETDLPVAPYARLLLDVEAETRGH